MTSAPETQLREIEALAARRQYDAAARQAMKLTASFPQSHQAWLALGRIRQRRGDIEGGRSAVATGLSLIPTDKSLRLLSIELAIQAGQIETGLRDLRTLERDAASDGRLMQQVAQFYTSLNLHADAERCHRRALESGPENPESLYNFATSAIAVGKLDEAESALDKVITLRPDDYDAYYNRATLRKQTAQRNHVAELERLSSQPLRTAMGEVQLCYALAKELEDLGEHRRSFAALKRGADARRRLLSYRVEDDIRAMEAIAATFNAAFFSRGIPGADGAKPIFVLGLPRSGSTLVDRILSSHSEVGSLGEINDLAAALMRAVRGAKDRYELIKAAAEADFASIGKNYVQTTRAVSTGVARAIDKTPVNFLYIGVIARALPDATIIHVRRGPMDVCYAMYKTLFRMAYPFSYDLTDIARYYLAYEKLMTHWMTLLPGRVVEVRYEELVCNPEHAVRKLVAACGLDWQDACLAPERNDKPSLTASAAQVRRKIYTSSVGLWRAYEAELRPLAEALRAGGVNPTS